MEIQTPIGMLGILEGGRLVRKPSGYDILLWRNLTPYAVIDDESFRGVQLLILDGSSKANILSEMAKKADSLGISYYVLKNNFAYVWDKKHGK